jgi:hypothetical protein
MKQSKTIKAGRLRVREDSPSPPPSPSPPENIDNLEDRLTRVNEILLQRFENDNERIQSAGEIQQLIPPGSFGSIFVYTNALGFSLNDDITVDQLFVTMITRMYVPQPSGGAKTKKNKKNKRKTKKQFLFNPNNPKKSFDVYIDKNPNDTINIKYTTVKDVESTIKKLERLYKQNKYPHKRIWQVGMILKVRLAAMKKNQKKYYPKAKNVNKRLKLSEKYFKFLSKRSKEKDNKTRKRMKFKFN